MNISQLRDTKKLRTWLRAGKMVELRDRGELIARIVPVNEKPASAKWPDFGDRTLDDFLQFRHREWET